MKNKTKKILIGTVAGVGLFVAGGVGQAAIDYVGQVDAIQVNFNTVLNWGKDQKAVKEKAQADLKSANDNVTQLTNDKADLQTNVRALVNEKLDLQKQLDDLKQINDNQAQVVRDNEAKINQLGTTIQQKESEIQQKIAEIQQKIDEGNQKVAAKQQEVDAKQATIDDLNRQLGQKTNENTQLQNKVAALKQYTDQKVDDVTK